MGKSVVDLECEVGGWMSRLLVVGGRHGEGVWVEFGGGGGGGGGTGSCMWSK